MKKILLISIASLILSVSVVFSQTRETAVKAYNYENYRTAIKLFSELIKSDPSNGENYYLLGNTFCKLNNFDSARIVYELGTKSAPKYGPNYAGLAKTYLNENNNSKALELFQNAKSTTSNKDVNYYVWIADAYVNNSNPNPSEAISQLKSALEINYKVAAVYLALGDAYYAAANGGEAVNNYNLALTYDPALITANSKIGIVWTNAQKFTQSLDAFQKALAMDPTYAPALKGLSDLYYATGQYGKAKDTYDQYMQVADINDDIKYRSAQILFLNKDYANALSMMNSLLSKNDSRAIIYRLSAYSNYELGSYDAALENLNIFFTKVEPKKIIGSDYEYMGKLMQKRMNDSLMVVNYLKAIEIDTTKRSLYNEIASMYYTKKNYKQAAKFYDLKIKSISKPIVQDVFALGRSYYFDTAYIKADSAFLRVTELSSTWPQGYLWRARSNLNLDKGEIPLGLAMPHYQKVIETGLLDSVKYKKELVEAYKYFGDYNTVNEKYDEALGYYAKLLSLDPANVEAQKAVDAINNFKKKN